jgi:curved DNA-binding protein CbpA
MSAERSLYDILGLEKNCSKDDIKNAYRTLAKKHHPDTSDGNEELFKVVVEAYTILIKDETRAIYDATGNMKDVDINQRIVTFLASCIIPALKNSPNVHDADIVEATILYLTELINLQKANIFNLEEQMVKLNEANKRFKVKPDSEIKENVFERIINDNILNIKISIDSHENEIDFLVKAKDFLSNFEYNLGDLSSILLESQQE